MNRLILKALLSIYLLGTLLLGVSISPAGASTVTTNGSSFCGQHWALGTVTQTAVRNGSVYTQTEAGTVVTTGHGNINRYCGAMPAGVHVSVTFTAVIRGHLDETVTLDLSAPGYGSIHIAATVLGAHVWEKVTGHIGS